MIFKDAFIDELAKTAGSDVKGMKAHKQSGGGWAIKFTMADGTTRTIKNAHNLVAGAARN